MKKNKFKISNIYPQNLSDSQLGWGIILALVTNPIMFYLYLSWMNTIFFCWAVPVWIYRKFQTPTGQKVKDAIIFAAWIETLKK